MLPQGRLLGHPRYGRMSRRSHRLLSKSRGGAWRLPTRDWADDAASSSSILPPHPGSLAKGMVAHAIFSTPGSAAGRNVRARMPGTSTATSSARRSVRAVRHRRTSPLKPSWWRSASARGWCTEDCRTVSPEGPAQRYSRTALRAWAEPGCPDLAVDEARTERAARLATTLPTASAGRPIRR